MKAALYLLVVLFSCSNSLAQKSGNNLEKVDGWYFRVTGGYPAAISFEPIVLFKDGTYFEIGEEALSEVDISQSKITDVNLWGKWTRNGTIFTLTNEENKSYQYDLDSGNWFVAFPYNPKIKLIGTYEKVSGGVYGNGLMALFSSKLTFLDDKHFTHAKNGGVTAYGSSAWKNDENSGVYHIKGNEISLSYNNGATIKLSFAIGAEGDNVIDTDMLFIGGKAYVIE
ncbi:hypothetical protein BUL40_03150 [Croceivirga radicis]|uniref:Lipocalin-like domain-containing protein n=1 Tax=Croceivirga radicis TaxID=1929488 RepID=A0A1V6LTX0_9FLAO|nr:hypothetical protein [Croceivirga radicis]OQD43625.1 hypothetical protein BUL40_03150 [Croceivirga radicis]